MASKIQFQYNIDSKEVVLATDRTLSLKEQIKAMRTELLKTEEGTAQFDILSKKLNDTTDNFNRVNAKSKELFGTFSLLPGPIGDIAGGLDNSIGLLKTFSGFSLKDISTQFGNLLGDLGEIISGFLGLNKVNKTLAATTTEVAVAQEGAAAAAEVNAVATEGLAVAEEGATVAATGLGAALKAIGIGLIIAAIAALVAYWDELKDAIMGTSDVTRAYDDAQKEVTKSVTDFNTKLIDVKNALKQAEAGTISKEKALKIYNDKLGETVGYAGSLEQAESLMASNTKVVIEGIKLRAQAQIFYAKSAEAAAKAISGEGIDPGFWQTTWNLVKSGGNMINMVGNQAETMAENFNDLNQVQTKFSAEGDKLTAQAIENDKKLKKGLAAPPEPKKSSTGKSPEATAKEQALKEIKALEEEGFKNSLSAREKEEYMVNQKYSKAIYEAIKYGKETGTLKELQAIELAKISEKYDGETFKKEMDRQRAANQMKSEEANAFFEKQKLIYGEDSKQAVDALNAKFAAETKIYQDELNALNDKASKGMKLTDDEIKKQGELILAITKVATTQEVEGLKSIDKEAARQAKKAENQLKALDKELENENTRLQRKKEILDEEARIEQEAYDKAIIAAGENQAKKDEIEDKHTQFVKDSADKRTAIEKASVDARSQIALTYLQAIEQLGSLLQGLAEENKDLAITGLLIEKAAALASIALNAKKNFIADGGIKSPIAWANLAVAGVSAISVIASAVKGVNDIKNAGGSGGGNSGAAPADNGPAVPKPRGLARGGLVTGPGTGTSDSIPAMLSSGESIINAASTAMFAPLLSTINQMGGGARFADGGIAPYSSIDKSEPFGSFMGEQPMIKTYVVASDMTNQQMLDRNAKMRSTI